ncbi:MAG TPA: bifunctional folylpolyglutamate synthase/dihydrofolate synthase [Euryarchaeota archaeon]|nr:bifunctional folylpolyglutamate synthase/dihydrofolate synthase [Euryarchaeota archaeon]
MVQEIEYLYSLSRFGIKLGLDVMLEFSHLIGDPQNAFRSAHITGTNGKGSTSAMFYSIVRQKYSAGLYTSPHIRRFNERIIVNDREIDDDFIVEWVRDKRKIIEDMGKRNRQPTFFEVTTAMAFDYFRKTGVDVAVVEVGMGGRLDSTNIIRPDVTGIVTVSLEHTDKLGDTHEKIAYEKAGIIKEGVPVVVGVEHEGALRVIREVAESRKSKIYNVNDIFDVTFSSISLDGTYFHARDENNDYWVNIPLIGRHQIKNALMAIKMAQIFDPELDYRYISNVRFPGRLEVKSRTPLVLTDAAHNPEAARNLSNTIEELFLRKPVVVVTQLKDKNYSAFLKEISRISDHMIVTEVKDERRKEAEILAEEAKKYTKSVECIKESSGAFKRAYEISDFILVTGSLYLLGEFEEWLEKR